MSLAGHRVVPFADQIIGVEWNGDRAREAVELAFGACTNGVDRLPDVTLRVGSRTDSPVLTLFEGRTCLYRGESVGILTHLLVQAALDILIRKSSDGLVMHAALLGRGDIGILLPGATGSGKTMLSAWLALRGFDCLSDEACFLADAASSVEGFARPFCFKGPWMDVLGLERLDQRRVLHDDAVSLVPPELLQPAPGRTSITPRLMVFPRFAENAALELERLTPARAAVRLIETVANARNLADHGVGRVTDLARGIDAYGLTYGRFDQLEPLMKVIESLG